jgi:hypothetical protein
VNGPGGTSANAEYANDVLAALVAIQTELGTLPKGSDTDVKTRLAKLDKLTTQHDLLSRDGSTYTRTTLTALLDALFSSTQGAVLYRGASAWAALAPGTSGDALLSGGASANPSWGSLGPAWKFVETITLSGSSMDTATLPTDADTFMLVLDQISSTAGALALRVNADSGANYDYITLASATLAASTGQTFVSLLPSSENGLELNGCVVFSRPATTTIGHGFAPQFAYGNDAIAVPIRFNWNSTAAITSIRFLSGSGNVAGKVHVFKLTKQ